MAEKMSHQQRMIDACKLDNFMLSETVDEKLYRQSLVKLVQKRYKVKTSDFEFNIGSDCSVACEEIRKEVCEMLSLCSSLTDIFTEFAPSVLNPDEYRVLTSGGKAIIAGQGDYGIVFVGQRLKDHQIVAIKLMTRDKTTIEQLLEECCYQAKSHNVLKERVPEFFGLLRINPDTHENFLSYAVVSEFCCVVPGVPINISVADTVMAMKVRNSSVFVKAI